MRTKIHWELNNYCTGGCSYCPSKFWGGEKPESITQFVSIATKIIDHYLSIGRNIDWTFTGGEPLEFFDLPEVMKLCKDNGGTIEIFTNGGKMWLDWWAVEPHVDMLHLTYHYWQNPNLIKFILQAFKKAGKPVNLMVPIRHDFFNEDMDRASEIEQVSEFTVNRTPLHKFASQEAGFVDYTESQFERLFGIDWVEENLRNKKPQSYEEHVIHIIETSPSYTGKRCNVGIEKLNITAGGWVSGSNCNNTHLGNIWDGSFILPLEPQICKMQACGDGNDQQITKFDR
jgi:organic radical activating enzyme